MKRICAWCKLELGAVGDGEERLITHGICDDCSVKFFGEPARASVRTFLDNFEAPLVVVDAMGQVVTANQAVQTFLGKSLHDIEGFLGGDVFDCEYASLPGGCGKTDHCPSCTIRGAVMECHRTRRGQTSVSAVLNHSGAAGKQVLRLKLTTEMVGEVVLLRIDKIAPDGATEEAHHVAG